MKNYIIIDSIFLKEEIPATISFYKDLYPNKIFKDINIYNIIEQISRWFELTGEYKVVVLDALGSSSFLQVKDDFSLLKKQLLK